MPVLPSYRNQSINLLCKSLAFTEVKTYLTSDQRNVILNFVRKSQFTYWPLMWRFILRSLNNALNNIHGLALWLIYTCFLFYMQLHFWVQDQVAKGFLCFQSESCSWFVSHSINMVKFFINTPNLSVILDLIVLLKGISWY